MRGPILNERTKTKNCCLLSYCTLSNIWWQNGTVAHWSNYLPEKTNCSRKWTSVVKLCERSLTECCWECCLKTARNYTSSRTACVVFLNKILHRYQISQAMLRWIYRHNNKDHECLVKEENVCPHLENGYDTTTLLFLHAYIAKIHKYINRYIVET